MISTLTPDGPMPLTIHHRFSPLPRSVGRYSAFPTLARCGERLLLAARTGQVGVAHGEAGVPRLLTTEGDPLAPWIEVSLELEPWQAGENNLDAIISVPGNGWVYLLTRSYDYRDNSTLPYLSRWPVAEFEQALAAGRLSAPRRLLHSLLGAEGERLRPHAAYGHIQRSDTGELLLAVYGTEPGQTLPSPWVLVSHDEGESWAVRGLIAHSASFGSYLNETALAPLAAGRWLAVIRSNQPPHPLYICHSADAGAHWSEPQPSGLLGHAPMAAWVAGRLLLIYRDLAGPTAAISLAEWGAAGWQRLGALTHYSGGIYDGGYGDLLPLAAGRLLAVAYLCDDDQRAPWVDGWVATLP